MQQVKYIFMVSLPVLVMIGLIPIILNDYYLTLLYILIISLSLYLIKCTKKDIFVLLFGFVVMIIFEYFFIATGVETFTRNSLFGIMPVWLPFLWGYGFVAIKRGIEALTF